MEADEIYRARVEAVFDALAPAAAGYEYPYHLLERVAALVGERTVVYADSSLVKGDDFTTSGDVLLLTDRLVVLAQADRTPERVDPDGVESTVTVEAWGRSALTSLAIEQSPGGDTA